MYLKELKVSKVDQREKKSLFPEGCSDKQGVGDQERAWKKSPGGDGLGRALLTS